MKRFLLALSVLFFVVGFSHVNSQTYLYLESVSISPVSPTINDVITITVSGNMSATNVIVTNEQVFLSGNTVNFSFEVSAPGFGLQVLVPYSHVFTIGPLNSGNYIISLLGDFVGDYIPTPQKEFSVIGVVTECEAEFSFSPDTISPPPLSLDLFQFTDLSTGGNIISWYWDFGDGSTSSDQNPVHGYFNMMSAQYIVCLTITTSDNCTDTYCDTVVVGLIPPFCGAGFNFAINSQVNCINCYDFTDNSYSSGNIISWFWNFDDGSYSTDQNPLHTFSSVGGYNICLNIITDDGCSAFYCDSLIIVDSIPVNCDAGFNYVLNASPIPEIFIAEFIDVSISTNTIASWYWDFGDGSNSSLQHPNHSYWLGNWGLNTVCLTITSITGCASMFCETIFVGYDPCMMSLSYIAYPANLPGGNNGFIDLDPMGGNPPYQYYWSNGETTQDINTLTQGNYVIWLVDSYGCMLNEIIFIEEIPMVADSQIIEIPLGWSFFSTYINPFSSNIEDVVASIVANVELVKDVDGMVFWPAWGVNAIGNIELGEGFQIKLSGSVASSLTVFGIAADPELVQINLNSGWNLIGYLRNSPLHIDVAFSSIVSPPYITGNLIIAKDENGDIYWPYFGVDNIEFLIPGEAYQLKMTTFTPFYYTPN